MGLGVCANCGRHARGEICPFCKGFIAAPIPRPRIRSSRSGLAIAAATLAVACGTTSTGDDASIDSMPVPAYGIAIDSGFDATKDAANDAADASDAGKDADASKDGGGVMYGGPPLDGGGGG
jgi:hypothetical protein